MSVRDDIVLVFTQVAKAQGRKLAPLSDDLKLTESGLDSLSFAIVVTSLEDSLRVDPFNSLEGAGFPITFGSFVALYERACAS